MDFRSVLRPLRAFSESLQGAVTPEQLRHVARYATLPRAWGLLTDFKYEQTDPDIFYGHLAEDTVQLISRIAAGKGSYSSEKSSNSPLNGLGILDVGGGPGYFGKAFDEHGAWYISCEPDVGEMAAAGITLASSVRGSGLELPFKDEAFDITYSSNVAEHVPDPWEMAREMIRVTKPGGLIIYSYTVWLGPFGGHETGLWPHYVSGEFAARRYAKIHGHEPKNRWGESLFDVSCAEGVDFARSASTREECEVVGFFPRYHPWWAWWSVKVPVFREFAVSNLVLVLRKRS